VVFLFWENRIFVHHFHIPMHWTKYFILSSLLLFGISCNENSKVTEPEPETQIKEPTENLGETDNTIVKLTPEAKTETSKWLAFVTAQSEVKDYRKLGLEYAAENAAATLQIMQKLQETIPEKFRTTPVEARINVLVTLAHVLKQEAENREPDKQKIARNAKKIPVAFDNLKIQLNEVFAQPLEEFQEMLEPETDSIAINNSTMQRAQSQ
jgi:hypothetical protein